MRIWVLWRYICAEYLRWFVFCLLGFSGLTIVVDLVNKAGFFLKHEASFEKVARYAMFQAPEFIHYVLPFAALFAMLIALAGLAKRNEVTAMLAGGIGRRSIVLPMAGLALLSSFAQFALSEYVVPEANARKRHVTDVEIKTKKNRTRSDRKNRWFYVDGGFLHVGVVEKSKNGLLGVLFLKPGDPGTAPLRVEGAAAEWNEEKKEWTLRDARIAIVDSNGALQVTHAPESILPVSIVPGDLADKVKKTEEFSARDLRKIIGDRQRLGQSVVKERVDLYSRFAMPLAGFVMALLGAPFAFREHRRGGAATGFLIGVVIAFGYVVVLAFSRALGTAGALPPEFAAWLPNFVFGGTGIYLAATLDSL